MPPTIQFRRGSEATMPALAPGEPAWTTDTHKLFVGDGTTAHQIGGVASVNGFTGAVTLGAADVGAQPLDADLTAIAALAGTNTIYYRSAANTWTAVTIGSGLTFAGGTLSATGGSGITQLTGDVTAGPGSGSQAATVANGAVTLAKMGNLALGKILGRKTASAGPPEAVTINEMMVQDFGVGAGSMVWYDNALGWTLLNPGTAAGQVLKVTGTGPVALGWGAVPTFGAAGASHSVGGAPDPGATSHANIPYVLGDDAAWHKPAGRCIGQRTVSTSETTTSTTPVDLTTTMSVTFTLDEATNVNVSCSASVANSTAGASCRLDIDVDGTDTRVSRFTCDTASAFYNASGGASFNLAAGSHTIKLQFSASTGTGTFADRNLVITYGA